MCFLLRRKKKKSDGIKSFYVQNDLGKDEVSSAHSILVASSGEVGVASRMNSRVSDWWDEPEGCWEVYPDLRESVSGEWGLPQSRVDCNHCIITCLLCLNQKRIMVEGALYSFRNDLPGAKSIFPPPPWMIGEKLQLPPLLTFSYLKRRSGFGYFYPSCLKISGKREVVMSLLLYSYCPVVSQLAQLIFLSELFFVVYYLAVLCVLGCLAVSMICTH